jgi:hypothetical protein
MAEPGGGNAFRPKPRSPEGTLMSAHLAQLKITNYPIQPTQLARAPATNSFTPSRELRPTGSLLIFWFVCLTTLVMSHYAISGRFNLPYKLMMILVVVMAPLTTGFLNLLGKRAVLWLLLFEVVLVVGCLTGYTGNPSDLMTFHEDPVVMVRVFPFMLCGFTIAQYPRHEKWFLFSLLGVFCALTVPDALTFASGSLQGLRRERLLTNRFDEASANAILSGYINLTLGCLIIAILGNRLRDLLRRHWRWPVAALQLVLASVCVTAGFTAAALLLLLSLALLGITAPVSTLRFRLVACVAAIFVPVLVWFALGSLAEGTGGTLGQIYRRLEGLRKAVISGEITRDTRTATSGRLDLGLISLRSFAKSPLIGLGKGRESSEIKGHNSDTIGGHSYILDSLGQRGLIGSFPLLAALGSFLMTAYRNFKQAPWSWRESAMLTIMPMWIVAMIINPYFLGYLALNCTVFLCFGLILGDASRLRAAGLPVSVLQLQVLTRAAR